MIPDEIRKAEGAKLFMQDSDCEGLVPPIAPRGQCYLSHFGGISSMQYLHLPYTNFLGCLFSRIFTSLVI